MSNEKEIDYQAYIDNLHAEIAELKSTIRDIHALADKEHNERKQLEAELARYKKAALNFFLERGASR